MYICIVCGEGADSWRHLPTPYPYLPTYFICPLRDAYTVHHNIWRLPLPYRVLVLVGGRGKFAISHSIPVK